MYSRLNHFLKKNKNYTFNKYYYNKSEIGQIYI